MHGNGLNTNRRTKNGEAWERGYFTPHFWAGYAIVNLNNHMAVGASQALAMWKPTQWWPDKIHLKMNLTRRK